MAKKNSVLRQLVAKGTYNTDVTSKVLKAVRDYQSSHPQKKIFMMGWGYTTQPLSPLVIQKLIQTSHNLGNKETYTSYESISGNLELKHSIQNYYLETLEVDLNSSEIFVNDGAQSALVDVLELFEGSNSIAFQNPWYPAFLEGTALSGRDKFIELKCNASSHFIPELPKEKADIIYLCFPNNPTGAVLTRDQLQRFVDYARHHKSVIIFDAVYTNFISTPNVPKSIYELEGAKECAIEIHSLSKMANFTGVRLGWTVIPEILNVSDSSHGELIQMWTIRNAIKFWGASNLAQQAAISALSEQGRQDCKSIVDYYMTNARLFRQALEQAGLTCYGGNDNPYIWLKAPADWSSDTFFHYLLSTVGIVGIPGNFFGSQGEGFLRLSTLGDRGEIEEVISTLERFGDVGMKKQIMM